MTEAEIFAYFAPPLILVVGGWVMVKLHLRQIEKELAEERAKEEKESPSFPGFFIDRQVLYLSPRIKNLLKKRNRFVAAYTPSRKPEGTRARH